jgi:hypothetical protein
MTIQKAMRLLHTVTYPAFEVVFHQNIEMAFSSHNKVKIKIITEQRVHKLAPENW